MSRSNLPEQTRMNAMRSRCFGSIFACILKMNPENPGCSGDISTPAITRDLGGGECFRNPSSKSCTPKLLIALPKNTGVVVSASTAASSHSCPACSSISSSSTVRWKVASSSRPRMISSCNPPTCTGDRKSTRLNSSHVEISYAVFCLKKKKNTYTMFYFKKKKKKNNKKK